ncbi:MAG: hypothetical protein L6R28_07215 [Planctomycetes bacterium]|nr:hypothetical protein [Planctomycetota bacterium]
MEPLRRCRGLVPGSIADFSGTVNPIPRRPRVLPGVPEWSEAAVVQGLPFLQGVVGWCMYPNLWDGDAVLCKPLDLKLPAGAMEIPEAERDSWTALERRIVAFRFGNTVQVKRLFNTERLRQLMLVPDNAVDFSPYPACLRGGRLERYLHVYGEVIGYVAGERDPEALAEAMLQPR